jgi:hypothetical protein
MGYDLGAAAHLVKALGTTSLEYRAYEDSLSPDAARTLQKRSFEVLLWSMAPMLWEVSIIFPYSTTIEETS